jgi:hypothetical protein
MQITCPLSKSSNIQVVETIRVKDIVKLYQKSLKFNVSSEFMVDNKIRKPDSLFMEAIKP